MQSLYTAIGQLTIYGLKHDAKRVLVVEDNLRSSSLMADLQELEIKCLLFNWEEIGLLLFKDSL